MPIATFLITHGAGAGLDSEFMVSVTKGLEEKNIEVIGFEFPYMKIIKKEGKRRPPDRMPKLLIAFEEAINNVSHKKNLFIGGKSMGGRVASLLAAEEDLNDEIKGVICLGFPFHPPKKEDKFRGEHLASISVPTLIVQGDRDTFGNQNEVDTYQFSKKVNVKFLTDGDHSFKPRVKSAVTLEENMKKSVELIAQFISDIINSSLKNQQEDRVLA